MAPNKKKHHRNRICDYCDDKPEFRTITWLKYHLIMIHEDEALRCVLCPEIFVKYPPYDTVRKHYQRHHRNDPLYENSLRSHKNYLQEATETEQKSV